MTKCRTDNSFDDLPLMLFIGTLRRNACHASSHFTSVELSRSFIEGDNFYEQMPRRLCTFTKYPDKYILINTEIVNGKTLQDFTQSTSGWNPHFAFDVDLKE